MAKHILYVDDEPQALKYFARLFGDQFKVLTAESADAAFALIDEDPDRIAVLVTDQRMPGRTGVELMEQVRARHPGIIRVLTTAHTHLESAIKAVNEGGAFRYLTKPWNEDEMIGTLLRAMDFHQTMLERDRLVSEKLSVLHRLVVMDRVRGLAIATTALQGRIRGVWEALVRYMESSPVSQRIQIQMDEIIGLNMVALARHEAEQMVKTVQIILKDTIDSSTGDEADVNVVELLDSSTNQMRKTLSDEDLELSVDLPTNAAFVNTDRGMLENLVNIMVRRLSDMQGSPSQISLTLQFGESDFTIRVRGAFGPLEPGQIASFFSAAIPLKKWPIGLDMDLLSSFMIAKHLGGDLVIESDDPAGPALAVTLPQHRIETEEQPVSPEWFDTVYESLHQWQDEMVSF